MSTVAGLQAIAPVPNAADFIDAVLNATMRKTPTQIHKNFKISRIRRFYMRKVKFTQDTFDEKLGRIISEFPVLDNLHPFLSSLLNVLYDKNHYKLALGQLNTCRHLISQVAKDYCRLLKFGDSLYRCKQLKRAALGRMATIMKRQKDPLAYLEQVRQHISRLPAIDPNTRTLLICGYPNVGKSSFVNKITRADVDVQPYAFTTKSLFVGHMDYKYLRWQVIDTPGVLDHPLEEMNTIEMQSITALAHLRSAVMYFMDLSEQCGYSVEAQCKLFHSIKPLFQNKPVILVINKIDIVRLSDLSEENRAYIDSITSDSTVTVVEASTYSEEGVMNVRNTACDALLAHRVEQKMRGNRIEAIANKVYVAMPAKRDEVDRAPFIPDAVKAREKYNKEDPERRTLERDVEQGMMHGEVFSADSRKNYILADDSWKYDKMPEFFNGKNVADFIDPDIEAKLEALEREEEALEAQGFYASDEEEILDSDEEAFLDAAAQIKSKVAVIKQSSQAKNRLQNRPVIPRKKRHITLQEMMAGMRKNGVDPSVIEKRAKRLMAQKKAEWEAAGGDAQMEDGEGDDGMDVDMDGGDGASTATGTTAGKVQRGNRQLAGLKNREQDLKATELRKFAQREPNRLAKASESDRHIPITRPRWMLAGKRKNGKTDYR
ncbi:P-loop containing nucleoside triphosphate hydrolase protein [Dioszegia hungarica]|uniref:Nucleolar GTP-binding protein 1 n=1 Tax=Dioszegia hungarica TaxID=4972 RepID=A0AA38HAY6_9TREE|nr:P-loop containing nucleoside triphosphate hydrolase protein [Dioszegia hungarica]KAI9635649.1 P-loop containing nucleoside triphosphate hydrolase protein [Dioszegia hungarica]